VPPAAEASPAASRQRRRDAALLFVLALVVYNANGRVIGSGDTLPARFLPFALLEHGTIYVDPVRAATTGGWPAPYWIRPSPNGHWVSTYPIATPLLVSPLYMPAVVWRRMTDAPESSLPIVGMVMEKVAASLVASAMVAWFYLLLRRRAPRRDALLLAAALGFATNTWMSGSQALWQHGVAELLVVAALWWLTAPPTAGNIAAAGAAAGLLAANRPPDALLAAAFGLLALDGERRRHLHWFVLAAAVPALATLSYNVSIVGHVSGGYAMGRAAREGFFGLPIGPGLAGLLLSPTKGLLVFSPFLLFVPLGFVHAWRDRRERWTAGVLAGGVLAQLLLYARTDWRAGFSYGPRFLADALPILVWLLPPALRGLSAAGRAVFLAACLLSVAPQAIGAFFYSGYSDHVICCETGERRFAAAWDPRNTPFLFELRYPRPTMDLARLFVDRWAGHRSADRAPSR